jgi:hypothetical protein
MELPSRLQERFEPVLDLAERWLRDYVDDDRLAEQFERQIAFRPTPRRPLGKNRPPVRQPTRRRPQARIIRARGPAGKSPCIRSRLRPSFCVALPSP